MNEEEGNQSPRPLGKSVEVGDQAEIIMGKIARAHVTVEKIRGEVAQSEYEDVQDDENDGRVIIRIRERLLKKRNPAHIF